MRKYLWIAVIVLITSAVYFTSCERIPKEMMDTIMPDAEQVEPPEPEPTETPEEMVETPTEPEPPEEMMPMPEVELADQPVDVLIYTGATWWITQEYAATVAETTKSLLDSAGLQSEITESAFVVQDWMLQTTANGAVNVLIVYGVLPDTIYAAGNAQNDGSIAENWIETTDGDTLLNQSDYLGWSSSGGSRGDHGDLDHGSNTSGALRNLMDNPNIVIDVSLLQIPMFITEDGRALVPSLLAHESDRPIPLDQLQGEWFAEKVFASDTGDAQATQADPVIVRDGDRGRLAIARQAQVDRPTGEVAAEMIINYLLAK